MDWSFAVSIIALKLKLLSDTNNMNLLQSDTKKWYTIHIFMSLIVLVHWDRHSLFVAWH